MDLDNANTNSEEEEREPFGCREFLTKKGNGKSSGGEDLHLVGDLEGGDGEVGDGDELERVLNDIKDSGDGELPAIRAEDLTAEVGEGGEIEGEAALSFFSGQGVLVMVVEMWVGENRRANEGDDKGYSALEDLV